jgi:hypothetical protein
VGVVDAVGVEPWVVVVVAGCVVFGVVFPAVLCGPSSSSPICSNTMPITTAAPMSSAPSNAA